MLDSSTEKKAFFYSTGNVAVTTAGVAYKLSTVTEGAGRSQRVGDELNVRSLSIRYSIQVGATGLLAAADQFNSVRLIVLRWAQDDGAYVPSTANILQSGSATAVLNEHYNFDGRNLYKVIYDKTHVVFNSPVWNGSTTTWQHGYGANFASDTLEIPLNSKISFDIDGTSAIGHYYLLAVSDSAFSPNPSLEFTTRLDFLDS